MEENPVSGFFWKTGFRSACPARTASLLVAAMDSCTSIRVRFCFLSIETVLLIHNSTAAPILSIVPS